jgi:hypothetical protein
MLKQEEECAMGTALIALFGILLPALTLCIELGNGMCAEAFFDPIPTLGHVLLVAMVPLANLAALIGASSSALRSRRLLLWLNAMAMGVSLVYAVAFLPITPIAVIAIIAMGMGFLPLSPLLALLCGAALRRRLLATPEPAPGASPPGPFRSPASLWLGGLLGALLVLVMEGTIALTLIGADMASSDSRATRARGMGLLRRLGNRSELLRMCYRDSARRGGFLIDGGGSMSMSSAVVPHISSAEAQKVYFRVTGQPYNSQPPPHGVRQAAFADFDFDPDVGGQAVAGRRKGLSLDSSRIDVQMHPDAAVAYLEWTMVFQNARPEQREARAQVLLPPGGVVSRVTLWVNGEPREAAFGGTAEVREAYQKVAVRQRRDPLLVTWAGVDRIMLQCFPVPPHGEMKIRLGITAPLSLAEAQTASRAQPGTAALRLPCFAERNFNIGSEEMHSLWIESDRPYLEVSEPLVSEWASEGRHVLRGSLSEDDLLSTKAVVRTVRSPEAALSWTPDPQDADKHVVQKVVAGKLSTMRRVVLVVDGSGAMAEHFDAIGEALAGLPANTELQVLVAGDEVLDVAEAAGAAWDPRQGELAEKLHALAGAGGCDNVRALLKALDLKGSASDDTAVVWVHAAQPVLLSSAAPLVQRLERGLSVPIHDVAVAAGPNRVAEELKGVASLQPLPRFSSLADDLRALLAGLVGKSTEYRLERARVQGPAPATPKSSSHVARLWAAGEVAALAGSGKPGDRAAAVKLAVAHQLVTPVTGAVVLETQQQYEDSKLRPVDPDATPKIPEPGTLALLLAALPALLWWAWRRRTRG